MSLASEVLRLFPTVTLITEPVYAKDYFRFRCNLCGEEDIIMYSGMKVRVVICTNCKDGKKDVEYISKRDPRVVALTKKRTEERRKHIDTVFASNRELAKKKLEEDLAKEKAFKERFGIPDKKPTCYEKLIAKFPTIIILSPTVRSLDKVEYECSCCGSQHSLTYKQLINKRQFACLNCQDGTLNNKATPNKKTLLNSIFN